MRRVLSVTPLLLASTLFAATLPATQPSTRPVADRSSPEKTWATVCAALKACDLAGFRANFHNSNEVSELFLEAFSDLAITTFDLGKATALLGDEGEAIARKSRATYTDLVKNGEGRKLEITGDTAEWTKITKSERGSINETISFKRIKGEWLIDTVETYQLDTQAGRAAAENMIDSTPKVTALLKKVIADIRNGKIITVEQMRKRMAEQ